MTIETLSYVYTSQAEIGRVMSVAHATLSVDDDEDSVAEDSVWDDIVNDATDYINQYCERYYEPQDMADNLWVRRRASWVGAYFASMRRGNPGYFQARFDLVTHELEKVFSGLLQIPRLPTRADLSPAMSNYTVDHRYAVRKIRVNRDISVGGTYSNQHIDNSPGYL